MDTLGVIRENVGDVLSESNTDASIVVHLYKLEIEINSIDVIEKD